MKGNPIQEYIAPGTFNSSFVVIRRGCRKDSVKIPMFIIPYSQSARMRAGIIAE
jgi:hypothetical protein